MRILIVLFLSSCGFMGKLHPAFKKKEDIDEDRSYKAVNCLSSNVKKVLRPVDPSDSSKGDINYSYQFINNNAPRTIILIPGGPGQSSIGTLKGWLSDDL